MPEAPERRAPRTSAPGPSLTAVVVHWRDEDGLARLAAAWPKDPAFELLVVDNSATLGPLLPPAWPAEARLITPGRNLGFAGGVNRGVAAARSRRILILNADARPQQGALERLAAAFDAWPDAAGVVPALVGPQGGPQHRWQLQPLPSPWTLLLQTFFLAGRRGPHEEPPRGAQIEQPAAAALAVRRAVLEDLGGLDEGFFPAWFEDVDLARRLADAGHRLLYDPSVRFVHDGGATVPALGYGPFLWIYYRGLSRYLRLHHGGVWSALTRLSLPVAMALRLLLLPVRRPRRAASRRAAAAGLMAVAAGAVSGWRRPADFARRFAPGGSP